MFTEKAAYCQVLQQAALDHQIINEEFRNKLDAERISSTDLRAMAKVLGKNHALAQDLWATNRMHDCLLAVLIMDPRKIDTGCLETLVGDIEKLTEPEQEKLSEWLLANQLMNIKNISEAIEPWGAENFLNPTKRCKHCLLDFPQGKCYTSPQTGAPPQTARYP